MPRLVLSCALLLAAVAVSAGRTEAQTVQLRGFVTDEADGQSLPSANVALRPLADPDALLGAATDLDGFYAIIGLEPGQYAIRVSLLGYEAYEDTLLLEAGTRQLDVELAAGEESLGAATVQGDRASGAATVTAGVQRIRPADIRNVPAPDVTGDLVNYLVSLPGIVTSGDRGGQLFIRGGEPSQNLVLLDGMPVFQPFHVLGFYSAFPTDLLSSADVYAGGYDARFGGQLSSVLDVTSRNGNLREVSATGSIAPFVSSLSLEAPLIPDKLSILASGRKSVVDQIADQYISAPLPFDFADAFGKLYFVPSKNSRFSLTGLYTTDRGAIGEVDSERPDEVRYTNRGGSFRYLLLPAEQPLLAEIQFSYSELATELGPSPEALDTDSERDRQIRRADLSRFNSEVNLTYLLSIGDLRLGAFIKTTNVSSQLNGLFQGVTLEQNHVTEAGFYLQPEFTFGGLLLSPGVRTTSSPHLGQSFIEPRFRGEFETGPHKLSVAAGLYNQPIVGVSDRRDATSVFTAYTVAPDQQTPEALHLLGGYRLQPAPFIDMSIEGFYKDLQNLSVSEFTAVPRLTTSLEPADGEAYGMDLRAEARPGKSTFSATYGLSFVNYTTVSDRNRVLYDDPVLTFRPGHDRRHQVTLVAAGPVMGVDLSARWQFGSGLPYSRALGFDVFLEPTSSPDLFNDPGQARVLYERPFNGVLPTYSRLDLSADREFDIGPAILTAQVGVINAYDRRNLFAFDIFTLRRSDQLPIIPTFGFKLETK
ncbi:MAG: carboxypeptidase regulatory-like domain-containing protein [Rubricoccaceae bacterium]